MRALISRDIETIVCSIKQPAIRYADLEVAFFCTHRAHHCMRKRDDLGVGLDASRAYDICIELPVFSEAAVLRPLVTKYIRYRIPARWHRDVAMAAGYHAGECRRHLRAQSHLAVAAIGKGVRLLVDDLFRCL